MADALAATAQSAAAVADYPAHTDGRDFAGVSFLIEPIGIAQDVVGHPRAILLVSSTSHDIDVLVALRHSKIAVTMEIYTEVPSAATRDALRKLSQWLDS